MIRLIMSLALATIGCDGEDGTRGFPGNPGGVAEPGRDGEDGKDGERGVPGNPGANGLNADPGPPGIRGPAGPEGPRGDPADVPPPPLDCRDAEVLPADRLTLASARNAFQWWQVRRHLRFLEVLTPGITLQKTALLAEQGRIDRGEVCANDLYEAGRLLFQHEFTRAEGLGNGLESEATGRVSAFRRVQRGEFGGPDTMNCGSCHWRGGPAGAGSLQDNAFLFGDGRTIESADQRNPPSLQGVGVAQLLAQEMSAELQAQADQLLRRGQETGEALEERLVAKGVDFGVLRVDEGGSLDTSGVEGVDSDLVIKPFGWKGTFATLRDFVTHSLHFHFGIQSDDLVHRYRGEPAAARHAEIGPASPADPEDPDGDGVTSELTDGQLTALVTFLAMQELPVIQPPSGLSEYEEAAPGLFPPRELQWLDEWSRGRQAFSELGCASCHVPMLVLNNSIFQTTSTITDGTYEIDLAEQAEHPRIEYDPLEDGHPVWTFSDFRRHDLGDENTSLHIEKGVQPTVYLTRRLWGLANSPPYMYDGHAPWFDHAIAAHGGEAAQSRQAYEALDFEGKVDLRMFLISLRRQMRPVIP